MKTNFFLFSLNPVLILTAYYETYKGVINRVFIPEMVKSAGIGLIAGSAIVLFPYGFNWNLKNHRRIPDC